MCPKCISTLSLPHNSAIGNDLTHALSAIPYFGLSCGDELCALGKIRTLGKIRRHDSEGFLQRVKNFHFTQDAWRGGFECNSLTSTADPNRWGGLRPPSHLTGSRVDIEHDNPRVVSNSLGCFQWAIGGKKFYV